MDSTSASPSRTKRLQAIYDGLKEGQALTKTQKVLYSQELQRQEVQERLDHLTQQVDSQIEDINRRLVNVKMSVDTLKEPNTVPILSKPVSAIPASSTIDQASTQDEATNVENLVLPGSRSPAYVVYAGRNNQHGVFYAWKTVNGVQGANTIYDHNDHNHVIRSFSSCQLAHQFYQEFVDAGIPKLLAEHQPSKDELFLILEGVQPMVCKNRKSMIMDALQFRGGVVRKYSGTVEGAWTEFNKLKSAGSMRKIHSHRAMF
ncbi:hypothetical protein GYMLUDRAFT_251704 [Collybiopsis luxurians FD-317 M1]|uniref:Uncharacterized protein n=1 Tax=Collybiopsis luxurians FD-317 M1 TaxID=944289 RepID=A0A0D0C201_9AGAR|nr:hypothetical protein GYMLUDRAFT_251704 [Collybiopsis luxurians FD-317 M1]